MIPICTKMENTEIVEEWIMKMALFAEMARLTCLIRDKTKYLYKRLETSYGLFAENRNKN